MSYFHLQSQLATTSFSILHLHRHHEWHRRHPFAATSPSIVVSGNRPSGELFPVFDRPTDSSSAHDASYSSRAVGVVSTTLPRQARRFVFLPQRQILYPLRGGAVGDTLFHTLATANTFFATPRYWIWVSIIGVAAACIILLLIKSHSFSSNLTKTLHHYSGICRTGQEGASEGPLWRHHQAHHQPLHR